MNFFDERLPQRFWDKVVPEPNSGCWLWTGHLVRGYGQIRISGRAVYAHRLSFKALNSQLTDGLVIDHLCRQRCCVNPLHMEEVTNAENVRRGTAPGDHHNADKTACPNGHAYSGDNVYINPNTKFRTCRTCQRASSQRWSERRKESE